MNTRKINLAGLALIMHFESFSPVPYLDTGGVLTIGYGHTRTVQSKDKIDIHTAKELLRKDCEVAEMGVSDLVTVPLNDNQYSALVSFAFNVGLTAFSKSTLRKKLNAGDYAGAASEFERWNKDNGVVLNGLTRRRLAEKTLFLTPMEEK